MLLYKVRPVSDFLILLSIPLPTPSLSHAVSRTLSVYLFRSRSSPLCIFLSHSANVLSERLHSLPYCLSIARARTHTHRYGHRHALVHIPFHTTHYALSSIILVCITRFVRTRSSRTDLGDTYTQAQSHTANTANNVEFFSPACSLLAHRFLHRRIDLRVLQLEGLTDAKIGDFDPVTNTLQFVDLGLVRVDIVTRNERTLSKKLAEELYFWVPSA